MMRSLRGLNLKLVDGMLRVRGKHTECLISSIAKQLIILLALATTLIYLCNMHIPPGNKREKPTAEHHKKAVLDLERKSYGKAKDRMVKAMMAAHVRD